MYHSLKMFRSFCGIFLCFNWAHSILFVFLHGGNLVEFSDVPFQDQLCIVQRRVID